MSNQSHHIHTAAPDVDSAETREWLNALKATIQTHGRERGHFLLEQLLEEARQNGIDMPFSATTGYINTVEPEDEAVSPANHRIEGRLRAYMRWNAMAMVVKANRLKPADGGDLGGHISSFASLATMLEVGFNHFWHGANWDEGVGGDCLYIQGHSSPGIYARAFLEGRLTEEQLNNFRQEVDGNGLSSYPHPKLMPDFWQFPTVSMGLGPLMAIYQARFLKYLHARGIADTSKRKVWAFCGDGEMDEPESLGAIGLAAREGLDNLVFVINCNLQRLDGPVRGNGKIIQELEGEFRGSGWNVIKLVWGGRWDALLNKDKDGILRKLMMETVDGDYQAYKANGGAYVRDHFFGRYPETAKMVEHMTDEEIYRLNRGGHDPQKVFAAYHKAVNHTGQPTVILVKTVKGYGMGKSGEGKNTAHQTKKLADEDVKAFRDRFNIPVPDSELENDNIPFYKPADDTPEMKYLHAQREKLGGYLPKRRAVAEETLPVPELDVFKAILEPTAEGREISTTQAYVRFLNTLLRDKQLGERVVPILVDEARTFGMEGLFRQIGIYNPKGQQYTPVDKAQVMYYKEDTKGQILQEGINEAGGLASWIAAATSYSTNNRVMIPFYTYYSMFGLQRVGDLVWAAGDMQARGFLLGGTSGRTTLNGEGLQHEDGHSHILSSTVPNCISYDPTFAHEVAVIMQDGLRRMVGEQENVFYYITLLNENYAMPGLREGTEEEIIKGMYLLQPAQKGYDMQVNLLGSGSILRESMAAKELLENDWGVAANVWSCPSFNELARDGQQAERWSLLNPTQAPRKSFVCQQLEGSAGPVIASTDYMKAFSEQIRPFMPAGRRYKTLGTDGFGRSDFRSKLREHFEINRHYIVVSALKALADDGVISTQKVQDAMDAYGIDGSKNDPFFA